MRVIWGVDAERYGYDPEIDKYEKWEVNKKIDDQRRVITRNYNADHWKGPVIQLNKIGIQRITEEIKQYECSSINDVECLMNQPKCYWRITFNMFMMQWIEKNLQILVSHQLLKIRWLMNRYLT